MIDSDQPKLLRQLIRFLLFSGTAALANLGAGYVFYEVFGYAEGVQYSISVAMAFFVGMLVSFWLNRHYTFDPSGRHISDEMRTFFLVSLGGLFLTVSLASALRNFLLPWALDIGWIGIVTQEHVNQEAISHLVAVGLVAGYSFFAHKYLSFGKGVLDYWRLGMSRLGNDD